MNLRNSKLGISIWAACCIGIGLMTAYIDGVDARSLIGSGLIMSSLICVAFASAWVYRLLKRKFASVNRDQHRDQ